MVRKSKKGKKASAFDKAVKTGPPPRRERKMERGIKVPPKRQYEVYSWSSMRIGDSFHGAHRSRDPAAGPDRRFDVKRRHPGWRYATRLEHENGVMRVWKIA